MKNSLSDFKPSSVRKPHHLKTNNTNVSNNITNAYGSKNTEDERVSRTNLPSTKNYPYSKKDPSKKAEELSNTRMGKNTSKLTSVPSKDITSISG